MFSFSSRKSHRILVGSLTSVADAPIENLEIENVKEVPSIALSLRGSWRIAQNLILQKDDFTLAKAIEYRKKL